MLPDRLPGNRQYCLDKAADCERKAAQARHPDAAKEFQSHCRKVARGSGNARFQPESRRHSTDPSSGRIIMMGWYEAPPPSNLALSQALRGRQ